MQGHHVDCSSDDQRFQEEKQKYDDLKQKIESTRNTLLEIQEEMIKLRGYFLPFSSLSLS